MAEFECDVTVIRDGKEKTISSVELVPSDVVLLQVS